MLSNIYCRINTINYACDSFAPSAGETHLTAFARHFRSTLGLVNGQCLPNYNDTIKMYTETSPSSIAVQTGGRQWLYQTCSEFGWYPTSGSVHQPFGTRFPVEFYTQLCSDVLSGIFSHEFIHNSIARNNVVFGGWNMNVRNVYFTNGLVDPWRTMGIQQDLNPSSPADIIPDASHCNDLLSISEIDSAPMLAVKRRVRDLFAEWLGVWFSQIGTKRTSKYY